MNEYDGLQRLEQAIARDFEMLNLPAANWVAQHNAPDAGHDAASPLDVLIVGGGMCGLTAAFHLRRAGIHNIRVIDAQPAGYEGPWRTFARMETLRSPKHLTGPASGLPNLTFRAWHEAQHGAQAWAALGYIPRLMWADYLNWFGRVTGAGVENGIELTHLAERSSDAGAHGWRVQLRGGQSGSETIAARFVVLATGREGLAVPRIPAPFAPYRGDGIDHSGDAPGRDGMRDRDVVVIGLGASAFDYAAEALEGGARTVRILGRSRALSRINKAKQIGYAGFLHGYPLLPDTEKADIFKYIFARGVAPPRGTVQRVMRHPNVELVLDAPVAEVSRASDRRFHLKTPRGMFEADRVVLGTGYQIDLAAAAYLDGVSADIRRWRDVLPDPTAYGELADFPYLGQSFEFLAATDNAPTAMARLLCLNHAAMLSLGNLANDIPAVSEGADRLTRYIAATLYLADKQDHLRDLHVYEEPELLGDEIPGLEAWWPEG